MMKWLRIRVFTAVLALLFVFLLGVLGFRFLYNYLWIDAVYMTVITITTVGFGELHPPSSSEKVFIIILIFSSIFIVGFAIKEVSEYILSKSNIGNLRQKRVQKKISSLENHIIVCGYGRNGRQAVKKIQAYHRPFVIVERDESIIERFSENNTLFVHGNAIEDQILLDAGLKKASTLICALPSDADNLFIVLSARQISTDLKIITRAAEETSYNKLKLAGADNIIMPDKIGGEHMASLVVVPDLVEFLDNLSVSGARDSINVEQIPFEKICPKGGNPTIRSLDLRKHTACSVIGYKASNGAYIVNPGPDLLLETGSKLIVIGRPNQIAKLKHHYHI